MRAFLDFEASSLAKDSYPIEVGWVFEDGGSESHLIRPAPAWTDWDVTAEAIHRIPRATLETEGAPHEVVAHRMVEALGAHQVYASAPSWDGKWLSVLLRAAGLPRHALRLRDTEEAQFEAAAQVLAPALAGEALAAAAAEVVAAARQAAQGLPVQHRALADAEAELRRWQDVRRRAEAHLRRGDHRRVISPEASAVRRP